MAILEERKGYGAPGCGGLHGRYRIGHRDLCRDSFAALETPAIRPRRALRVVAGRELLDDPLTVSSLNLNDVREYRQRMRSFDAFGWMRYIHYNLTAPGEPRFLNGIGVTPPLADSLGVNPKLGRWFRDMAEGPVAVISDGLWRRLGADTAIVGKTVTLSGRVYTVTGVMPPGSICRSRVPAMRRRPTCGFHSTRQVSGRIETTGDYFCYAQAAAGRHAWPGSRGGETRRRGDRRPGAGVAPTYTARVDAIHELSTRISGQFYGCFSARPVCCSSSPAPTSAGCCWRAPWRAPAKPPCGWPWGRDCAGWRSNTSSKD